MSYAELGSARLPYALGIDEWLRGKGLRQLANGSPGDKARR